MHPFRMLIRISTVLGLFCFAAPMLAWGQDPGPFSDCGNPFENGVGPYDYRDPVERNDHILTVERFHFNSDVQSLRSGETSAYIMTDLDYVLRAVPNHHLALAALARYAPRRTPQEAHFRRTECYFWRAVTFRPDDPVPRAAYGVYLMQEGRLDDAEQQYLKALEIDDSYAEAHYNLGLLYVRKGDLDKASQHADKAYELGFPLPGLKRKIERMAQSGKR